MGRLVETRCARLSTGGVHAADNVKIENVNCRKNKIYHGSSGSI